MSLTSSELKEAFLSGKNNKEDKLEEIEMEPMGAGPSGNVAGSSSIPRRESAKKQSVTSQNVAVQVESTCRCETRLTKLKKNKKKKCCCNFCVSTRAKCITLWVLMIGLILGFLFGGLFYVSKKIDAQTSEIAGLKEAIDKVTKKD